MSIFVRKNWEVNSSTCHQENEPCLILQTLHYRSQIVAVLFLRLSISLATVQAPFASHVRECSHCARACCTVAPLGAERINLWIVTGTKMVWWEREGAKREREELVGGRTGLGAGEGGSQRKNV